MVVGLLSVLFISQMYPQSREYLGNIIAAVLLASVVSFILFMLVFNKVGKEKKESKP
jgi:Na+/citrate or Na+/malate symporter